MIIGIIFVISKEFEILKMDIIEVGNSADNERHGALIKTVDLIENLTSPIFLFLFVQSSLLICSCGFYVLTTEEFVGIYSYGIFFVIILLQMLLICAGGQRIIDASQDIANAAY
jgi:hypothetical protein